MENNREGITFVWYFQSLSSLNLDYISLHWFYVGSTSVVVECLMISDTDCKMIFYQNMLIIEYADSLTIELANI